MMVKTYEMFGLSIMLVHILSIVELKTYIIVQQHYNRYEIITIRLTIRLILQCTYTDWHCHWHRNPFSICRYHIFRLGYLLECGMGPSVESFDIISHLEFAFPHHPAGTIGRR